jgi:FtsP/CotA-like multicopper oxidase with cupredoxin domain
LSRDPKNLAQDPNFQSYFEAFANNVPVAAPPTPDLLPPDRTFVREAYTGLNVPMPNPTGNPIPVEFWGFKAPDPAPATFPSETIRVVEKEIFHCTLMAGGNTHTIHWHGLEPTSMNDGVGNLSFEVGEVDGQIDGSYTYQLQANSAGTYFYHCHKNTVLHFEMGMYGLLLVDPPNPNGTGAPNQPPYPNGGPGFIRRGNEIVPYDVEAVWVTDDVDPRWHNLEHDAGFGDGTTLDPFPSARLNVFEPQYLLITGVPQPWCGNRPTDSDHPGVAATVRAGQTLLVRLVVAAYSLNIFQISGLDAEIIAMDGRALGQTPYTQYSHPLTISAGVPFEMTAAQRFDLLIKPTADDIGIHKFVVEFRNHINIEVMGIAETFIHVIP